MRFPLIVVPQTQRIYRAPVGTRLAGLRRGHFSTGISGDGGYFLTVLKPHDVKHDEPVSLPRLLGYVGHDTGWSKIYGPVVYIQTRVDSKGRALDGLGKRIK